MTAIVKPSLREILANSHVATVAIAVLLLRSCDSGVRGLGRPLFRAVDFLVNVVAIGGIPYGSSPTLGEWLALIPSFAYLFRAVLTLAAAWILSHWVFGVDPLRSLSECRTRLARKNDA
jgi:hypothetical protein